MRTPSRPVRDAARTTPELPDQRTPRVVRPGTLWDGPTVIGHRGTGEGPEENTLEAFLEAVALGATWVEADVQLCADDTLVVHHDLKTPDGHEVRKLTGEDADRLGILRLDDLHAALPEGVGIDLEVKGTLRDVSGNGTFDHTQRWALARLSERPLVLTSFCPSVTLGSPLPTGVLTDVGWEYHLAVLTAVRLGSRVVATHASVVLDPDPRQPDISELLDVLEEHDLVVLAWGVEVEDVEALVARGVTGLCGDDVPGLLRAVAALG